MWKFLHSVEAWEKVAEEPLGQWKLFFDSPTQMYVKTLGPNYDTTRLKSWLVSRVEEPACGLVYVLRLGIYCRDQFQGCLQVWLGYLIQIRRPNSIVFIHDFISCFSPFCQAEDVNIFLHLVLWLLVSLWYDVIKPDNGITGIHFGYSIYFTAISKAWYQTFTTYWWRICRINSNVFL
jgi:hypothetical protein